MPPFLRDLFHFEADLGAAGGAAAAAPVAEPVPVAADPAPSAAPAPTGGEPPIDPGAPWVPPQEEWGEIRSGVQSMQQIIEAARQEQQRLAYEQQYAPPAFDDDNFNPFDPQQIMELIDARAEQLVEQRLGPVQGLTEAMAKQRATEVAKGILTQHSQDPAIGAFDVDHAFSLVEPLMVQGYSGEQAVREAAVRAAQFEQAARARGVEAYRAQVAAAAGATPEPAAGTGTAVTVPPSRVGDGSAYKQQARASLARLRAETQPAAV